MVIRLNKRETGIIKGGFMRLCSIVFVFVAAVSSAQPRLVVESKIGTPGEVNSIELRLQGQEQEEVFGLQWTLNLPELAEGQEWKLILNPENIGTPAFVCNKAEGEGTSITCLYFGVPDDGLVARIEIALPADFNQALAIGVENVCGVNEDGGPVLVEGTSGAILVTIPPENNPDPQPPQEQQLKKGRTKTPARHSKNKILTPKFICA